MKITIIVTTILMTFNLYSQSNLIKGDKIFETKFKGVSLSQISDTNGDCNELRSLFNFSLKCEPNITAPYLVRQIYNDDLGISFDDETDTGDNYYISSVRVKSSSIPVVFLGNTIKIGDHKSNIGTNYKIINSDSNTDVIAFVDDSTGTISLAFEINSSTDLIKGIRFTVF